MIVSLFPLYHCCAADLSFKIHYHHHSMLGLCCKSLNGRLLSSPHPFFFFNFFWTSQENWKRDLKTGVYKKEKKKNPTKTLKPFSTFSVYLNRRIRWYLRNTTSNISRSKEFWVLTYMFSFESNCYHLQQTSSTKLLHLMAKFIHFLTIKRQNI